MLTILKKEIRSFFGTPAAYLVASIFVIITSLSLWFFDNEYNVFNLGTATLSSFFFIAPWVMLLIVPALTMRQIAEEKQLGTLDWLLTQPLKIRHILLGKYLSVVILVLFILLATIIFPYTLTHFSIDGKVDSGSIIAGYLGLFLLSCLFASIGIMVSSFTQNQVIAYVASVFICFVLFYGFQGLATYNLLGNLDYYIQQIGAEFHYNSFVKGIIDTRDLIYFIGLSSLFLYTAFYQIIKTRNA